MYTARAEFIKAIKMEFMQELDKRSYEYSYDAIEEIFGQWFENKQMLLELLSKHPNWDAERFMVKFDEDYTRELDTMPACQFVDWLRGRTRMDDYTRENEYGWIEFSFEHALKFVLCVSTYITESEWLNKINEISDEFRFREGMKATKVMGKICKALGWDQVEGFNAEYAKYCDAMSPIKVTRHTCISLNPVDYLLMSNGNSWRSCHYIGDTNGGAGCYSSGTISYMLDANSIVFYTVDASFDGKEIERAKKLQRQIFGYNDFQLFQSRLYPQAHDYGAKDIYTDIRGIMQKVFADCMGLPNLWVLRRKGLNVRKGSCATCYPDWDSQGNLCSTSIIKGKADESLDGIVLGYQPICITCGEYHHNTENISCCQDYSEYTCEDCGRMLDEDDVYWVNGDPYCRECVDYCHCCSEYTREETTYIESEDIYVCESCLEYYYYWCDECEEYHNRDYCTWLDVYDKYVCDDCIEEYYEQCDECGKYYKKEDVKEIEDEETGEVHFYCKHCAEANEAV